MSTPRVPDVLLNRFPVKFLSETQRTVQVYSYIFNSSPEPGKEYSAINRMLWQLGTPAASLGETVVTQEVISPEHLQGESWILQYQEKKLLNPAQQREREILERLERRCLEKKLKQSSDKNRVERSSEGGFIWWNANKIILQNPGWEIHTGVRLSRTR